MKEEVVGKMAAALPREHIYRDEAFIILWGKEQFGSEHSGEASQREMEFS